jgi:predicted kinase
MSQQLLEQLGALRLRSDVTRKRLFGLQPLQESAAIQGGIYTPDADRRTLTTLAEEAKVLLAAGFLVIVDATFLHRRWRDPFQALAGEIGVPWLIVALSAPL